MRELEGDDDLCVTVLFYFPNTEPVLVCCFIKWASHVITNGNREMLTLLLSAMILDNYARAVICKWSDKDIWCLGNLGGTKDENPTILRLDRHPQRA